MDKYTEKYLQMMAEERPMTWGQMLKALLYAAAGYAAFVGVPLLLRALGVA